MSQFILALPGTLKHEGVYSDDPDDPGGPTKYGWSLRTLQRMGDIDGDGYLEGDLDHDGDVDADDVRMMTVEDATALYKSQFWDRYRYNRIKHQVIANKVFDLSVNMGPGRCHRILQQSLRSVEHRVAIDGLLGRKSFSAINASPPFALLCAGRSEAAGFYRGLRRAKYINGWLNRAYS